MNHVQLDTETTIQTLKEKVYHFTKDRDWIPAHDAKNLAMSIAIEAAELMEHFQWGERSAYTKDKITPEELDKIRLEVADVMIYLLSFCRNLDIDLAQAIVDKVSINDKRWPLVQHS